MCRFAEQEDSINAFVPFMICPGQSATPPQFGSGRVICTAQYICLHALDQLPLASSRQLHDDRVARESSLSPHLTFLNKYCWEPGDAFVHVRNLRRN